MQATAATHNVLPRQASSTVPSIVPLTTITTYPASCSDVISWSYLTTGPTGPLYFKAYWGQHPECHPPEWGTTVGSAGSMKLYSPGVCPSGWDIHSQTFDTNLGATEAYCCPRGTPALSLDWGAGTKVCATFVLHPTTALSNGITVVTSMFPAFQWAVSIAWAESDLTRFTPASAPLLARFDASSTSSAATIPPTTSNAATIAAATSNTASTKPTTTPNGKGGLSTGAQAGIGVGVAIPVLATLAGLCFFFYRRRKRRYIPEISASGRPRTVERPRYRDKDDGRPASEMDGGDWAISYEMNNQTKPSELEGSELEGSELAGSERVAYQPYHGST